MRRKIETLLTVLIVVGICAIALTDPWVQEHLLTISLVVLLLLAVGLISYWIGLDHGAIRHSKKVRGLWDE